MLSALLILLQTAQSTPSVPTQRDGEIREMRGVWVTRWTWDSESDIRRMMAEIDAAGLNAVFFQVRGEFDAYYPSEIEPWAIRLTGRLGGDPGWDPLAVAVDAAHEHGLQLHAYMNVFPLWKMGLEAPAETEPVHARRAHPAWEVQGPDGSGVFSQEQPYYFASPGNPEVRFRVAQVAADIDFRYAVDGIHLDYIRYPHREASRDPVSLFRYDTSKSWEDWQRAQVLATVAAVSARVQVPVTAAVWGVNENKWGWKGVSQGKHDFYQDSHEFLERGVLDAIAPMIYWPTRSSPGARLDFTTLVADHVAHRAGRHVYAGISGELEYADIVSCVRASRAQGAQGVVLFDFSLMRPHLSRLRKDVFAEEAEVPKMSWR